MWLIIHKHGSRLQIDLKSHFKGNAAFSIVNIIPFKGT